LHLKKDIQDINRFRHILTVFLEKGLGYYLVKAKLHLHLPWHKRLKANLQSEKREKAVYLREAFEDLGPTFVKLGQLLSLRPDLVPKEFSEEFEKLQDAVPSFPFSYVKKVIEEDLGKPFNKIFKTFDKKPIASASIAQVHKAELKNGKKVAVKIQRPNIEEIINLDLDILFFIAKQLEKHFLNLKNYHPTGVVKEFAMWTRRELNFEHEAKFADQLKEELKDNHSIRIPKVYHNLSSKRILTLDFVDGVKINDLDSLKKYKISRKRIAKVYFNSILEQALLHGLFHADPHPANIFVQKNGKLVYLDYGIMGSLSVADRKKIIQFIVSLPDKNPEKSLNILTSLARDTSRADLVNFKKESLEILEKVCRSSIGEESFGKAIYEVISLGAKYNVIFDPNQIMMAKAVYQAEGLGLELDPDFKVADALVGFGQKYLQKEYSPLKLTQKIIKSLWNHKELLLEFPEHLVKIIDKLENDTPPQQTQIIQTDNFENEVNKKNNGKIFGLIISTLIIAMAILLYFDNKTELFSFPVSIILLTLIILLIFYFFMFSNK
jgi:ubiquinone biosynthesis protein